MPHQTKHKRETHQLLRDIGEAAFEIKRRRQSAHLSNEGIDGLLRQAQACLRRAYEMTRAVDAEQRRADDERRIDAAIMGIADRPR